MNESIVHIDTSEVHAGKLNELKAAMESLARFVEANEPRIIAYNGNVLIHDLHAGFAQLASR